MSQSITLASGSDIRRDLLKNAGVDFSVTKAAIDEESLKASFLAEGYKIRDVADALAEMKALRVSQKSPESLVIGCDQILSFEDQIISKSGSKDAARELLLGMRAKRHDLFSAVVIAEDGKPIWRHLAQVRMYMRDFSEDYLDDYLDRNWQTAQYSVGCYMLEEEGIRLFSRVQGDYFAVLGLPMVELLSYLTLRGGNTGMTRSDTPLAAVIGSPIAHSKSPQLHNYWLRANKIEGFYVPMNVQPEDLELVVRMLPKAGFVGANVTIPHKEAVLKIADLVTDRAALIGAANTLVFRKDGKIHADNTDGYGFVENLRQNAPDWDPKKGPALVIGAGGAARAVLASLIEIGVTEILLTNRTHDRAEALRKDFGPKVTIVDWLQAGNVVEEASTIVNTTSLGMVGKPEFRVPLDGLQPGTVVNDLVYTPLETQLLKTAKDMGCVTVDGLGMLLHQAAPGFERWFGVRPTVDRKTRKVVLR